MNGSSDQLRNEPHDDDLGLGIVDEVASTSRASRPAKPRGWIFGVLGLVIVVVLALVIFSLRSSGSTDDTSALKADDAISNTLQLRGGGIAEVTTSESANALAVEVSGLPELDESQSYVVWGVDGDGNVTVLLQSSGEDETGGVSPVGGLESIHVTVEATPLPDAPTGETEASVDLPLQAEEPAQDSPAPQEG